MRRRRADQDDIFRDLLEVAYGHFREGRFEDAEHTCRELVQNHDGAADAWFLLGNIARRSGDVRQAVSCFETAVAQRRGFAPYLGVLGEAYVAAGNLDAAAGALAKAARLDPDAARPLLKLGVTEIARGRPEQGARHCKDGFVRAVHQMARAIRLLPLMLGARLIAFSKWCVSRRHTLAARIFCASAGALRHRDRPAREALLYGRAIEIEPDFFEALLGLARALSWRGDHPRAATYFERAVALCPGDIQALTDLGHALTGSGKLEEAIGCFERALVIERDYPDALEGLGWARIAQAEPLRALPMFETAIAQEPKRAGAHMGVAVALRDLGKLGESNAWVERALAIKPAHVDALCWLIRDGEGRDRAADAARVETLLRRRDLSRFDRMSLHFAAGKLYDEMGTVDQAFEHYEIANALKDPVFDAEAHTAFVDSLIETFGPALFARIKGFGSASERPVFIVGMPRSGTSLVEQIIATHTQVFGAGELDDVRRLVATIQGVLKADRPYPECVAGLDAKAARSLAANYLDKLRALAPEALRVTDKAPLNCLHLGLIAILFPKARIVHCMREPLDICVSIFLMDFGGFHAYAYDLGNLGHYYRQYERVMAHWREVLPIELLEVRYEDLIADQEATSRRIIGYCGLAWEDRCLAFHETERTVSTASYAQVRRPIYKSSVGRWKRYEKHLAPLKEALASGPARR